MNDLTIDYVMTTNVIVIAVCLLLTLVWLALRVANAAVVLCHSVSVFVRSLVTGAAKASPSARTGAVDGALLQMSKQPAEIRSLQPADDKQTADSKQSADGLQPAVSSLQTAEAPPTVVVDGNAGRVDKGSAAPLPTTSTSKSINCRQGSAMSTPPSPSTRTGTVDGAHPHRSRQPAEQPAVQPAYKGSAMPTPSTSSTRTIAVDAAQAQGSATLPMTSPASSTTVQVRGPAGARERARPFAECYAKWVAAHVGVAGPIARDDLWHLAQQFAETSGEALPKRDNFFAAFAKVRGVQRLSDKRITVFTKKGRPIEKTTAYAIAIDVPPDIGGA